MTNNTQTHPSFGFACKTYLAHTFPYNFIYTSALHQALEDVSQQSTSAPPAGVVDPDFPEGAMCEIQGSNLEHCRLEALQLEVERLKAQVSKWAATVAKFSSSAC